MSENTTDNPKITTIKKEKDPKRVEAGKRLAAISKEAKERKMREKIEAERTQEDKDKSWDIDYGFLFGVVGVVTATGSLYYARKEDIKLNSKESSETNTEEPKSPKDPRLDSTENCHSSLNESL